IGYTTPYGDRINVTSTYKFMRGYNYDTYLWKDTEYSVGDEVTGEVYKEISFEKPYYTIYRNGAYMYGTPLVDYYKNWFDYFNFIIYLAADYKVKLEIPTLYELYNKTIDTIEFTFPYLSDVPIIKDINAPPRYEVGVPFTITANITDDTDLKKINFSYWNGFSWIEIPYIVDGDLYSIILNISTLKHLDIIVFAEDEHNQTHQVEIKSVSMKTQPLNFELEYDYEVYKGGDEIYIDGSLLDDDSGAGYLKVDFFVDDLYVDSYPTNDLGNFDFWYDIPLDYANEELKLTMRAGNTGIYDLNEKTIYFDINLEPLHITITNPKNNAVIEDNKVLLTATTNWPATCEYELNYANVWLPMNQTGTTTHSHLIQLDWNNSYVVYLNCSKTDGTFVYEAVRFSTIEEPHYPPILQPISNMTTYENKTITIIASATDANNDDLSFSINDSRFDQNENIFSWTPDFEDAGDYSFRIIVTDNEFNSSQTFRVHVQNTNRKPVINSTPVIDAYVGGKYEYDVDAYDLDGDSLMYGFAITTDMGWLDINSQTGLVEGTPYEEGIFSLLIIVSDEYDEESETYQRFNITVHPGVKISNVSYELTENSAIITWDTNNNSNSIVQYGLDESL
ncbi:MAG: hypothetical protein KKF89_02860, partial [Nanoarchaeota archaeon]|nr:hypothetical protein [Nanoarchaeota archaeon]